MKPEYVNTFGVRKVSDKEGNLLELTLDATYKYMETAVTVTPRVWKTSPPPPWRPWPPSS